ncbi:MAG TPA: hypothetical protein VKB57_17245 [Acidimicrobiales bacterium]|nr:hypothetical protein [Acidimicrobiales bacterium]
MALCAVVIALLAILNLLGVQVGSGSYRAEVGGTAAEWFSGVATLVALPAAVVVGLRQARAQSEATAFERRRAHAERAAAERLAADAVDLDVGVANLVDEPGLASEAESAAAARWRDEVRQRGWVPVDPAGDDAADHPGTPWAQWRRDGRSLSAAELLAVERSPILPRPFTLVARCRNGTGSTVVVERWTVRLGGREAVDDRPQAIRRGEAVVRRLNVAGGGSCLYATASAAARAAAEARVVVEGADVFGRTLRIEHPHARPGEPADAG